MVRAAAAFCCVLAAVACPGVVAAQEEDSPFPLPDNPIVRKVTIDRAGGVHLTKLLAVVFGGIKQGSGMAVGPALSREFADHSFVQLKSAYSIRNFKLVQARYDSRPLLSGSAMFSTRLRWQDAPELSLYAIGPESPHPRAEYGERKLEWSGFVRAGLAPHLTTTVGSGFEYYAIDAGFIDTHEDERLGIVPDAPGLATQPWFVHSYALLAYDTRLSPDYSRTGSALSAGTHFYHDLHDGRGSFHGVELGASRLLPTIAVKTGGRPDWKGALEVSARAWFTTTAEGHAVPFFLMPTLGGSVLIGYPDYRLRDRNALLLRGEYSWAVHPMVDVLALYEAGTVAPTVRSLGAHGLAQSAAAGIHVHSKSTGVMRLYLARSREGLQFSIGFNIAGG